MIRLTIHITILLSFLFAAKASAQISYKYTILGLGVGTTHASGDVATTITLNNLIEESGAAFYIFYRRTFSRKWAVGIDASMGKLYAYDANHTHPDRGFEMFTNFSQLNGYGEFTFLRFLNKRFENSMGIIADDKVLSFYLKAGIGVVNWTPNLQIPNPELYGNIIVSDDNRTGINTFTGGGLRYKISDKSELALEVISHYLFRDDLEGFRYRNNRTANDVYGGLSLRYGYILF